MARINTKPNKDLQDSPEDQQKLQPEQTDMLLPEVKDIPGQEHIHVPPLGELADTTASSDDEEGAGLLDDLDEDADLPLNEDDEPADENSSRLSEDTAGADLMDEEERDLNTEDDLGLAGDDNVSDEEKQDLEDSANITPGEEDAVALRRATLDDRDDEGEPLEERTDVSGDDLDEPEPDLDDEENDTYSLGDDNDEVTEGTP